MKDLGERSGEGVAFCSLGNTHCHLRDFKAANDYHERHLKIAKEQGDRSGEGVVCRNLRITHSHLGDFEAAKDYIECPLKIEKELADRSEERELSSSVNKILRQVGDSLAF